MQHEEELRSDIDYLIDILRANPKTKFTVAKLQSITGLSISFLKKWINVLEEQGRVRFFYGISDEEFAWITNDTRKQSYNDKEIAKFDSREISQTNGHKKYSGDEIGILLEDIKTSIASTKEISSKISRLGKSRVVDLAALGLARHMLGEKKKELSHLLSEAKRLRN